jgi:hypothetical protein
MSDQTRVSHPIYNLLPTEIEGFDSLAELALDVHWSWNHATDGLWRTLDPVLWDLTQNPWVVLQTVSRDQLERVLADPAFRNRRPRDQRSPRAHLGLGSIRRFVDGSLWQGALAGDNGELGAGHSPRLRHHALEIPRRRQQVSCGIRSRATMPATSCLRRVTRGD